MSPLFPHHPCVLARESNALRCESVRDAGEERCVACRVAMRERVWDALVEGDRSFAEFVLADDPLIDRGFFVGEYRGASSGEPVFGLVRSKTGLFENPGDCAIVPVSDRRYFLCATVDDEEEKTAEIDTLEQAESLLSTSPL